MRFPIDALFLDSNLRVLDIVERLRPWRVASRHRARAVLELSAGESSRRGVRIGDRLGLRERKQGHESPPREVGVGVTSTPQPSGSIIWPSELAHAGTRARLEPMRVLIASADRHFRSATTMLLAHRGCAVTTTSNMRRVVELAVRDRIHVVVVDAGEMPSAAALTMTTVGALARPVGVVVVDGGESDEPNTPAVQKWGPFEDLFNAIERADRNRGR
jgi:hypothetical protein